MSGTEPKRAKVERKIELRSDTFTLPTDEMRKAMAEAVLGDDVWGEDPTVIELQNEVAALVGKEAALFVPSGTMSNLVAQLVHCATLPSLCISGNRAHTVLSEVGGAAVLGESLRTTAELNTPTGGIHVIQIPTNPDGTLPLDLVEASCPDPKSPNHALAKLLILENSHNFCAGRVLPMSYIKQARELCDRLGLSMHCDGARLWNAAEALGMSPAAIAAPFDRDCQLQWEACYAPLPISSLAPAVFDAWWEESGVLAAAGLVAVRTMRGRLSEDHANAAFLASGLRDFRLRVLNQETNIVIFDLPAGSDRADFFRRCALKGVFLCPMPNAPLTIRAVTHYGIERCHVEKALKTIGKELKRSS